jgi:lipopolysaccharide biosynthesis protein
MINKKIIEWTRNRYNKNNRFIFINAWNEWGEGTYLEPDRKYGYASINSLSKALFDMPYKEINIDLSNFNNESIIAIQVHLYYDDLISEIINKTNNIPFLFDLFISTDSLDKKNQIMHYIKQYSKSRNFEVMIFENKGRDVMPFLFQMKQKIKRYKYICHIHTKKSLFIEIGESWRKYLYNNLLGSENIVTEILSDFENNDKLGFAFPENYYKASLLFGEQINYLNKKNMKYLLHKLFHNFKLKIGEKIVFPLGNMFWAKTKAIFQIFNENFENEIPEEFGQKDGTIMHAIERIWLYIVQSNGYYYKTIFKHF